MTKKLILVGTSHIAKQSVSTVKKAIDKYEPEAVGVELDIGRFRALMAEQKNKGNQKKKRSSMYMISKVGFKGYMFAMLGSWGMKKLAKFISTNPGDDMLSAIKHSNKKEKKTYLIDQNINVTLKRFSKALGIKEIWRFIVDAVRGMINPKKEMTRMGFKAFDLNKVPDDELIEKMISYMSKRYPSLYKVLVHERNVFMSKKIMKIMDNDKVNMMVVVIGAGHKKGMQKFLEDQPKAKFDIVMV